MKQRKKLIIDDCAVLSSLRILRAMAGGVD